ncbi:MAG: hypothetical protein LBK99_05655 [Opitutaceae bacterium]|jgi:hypothetical protein|nr:hypothetical protein [Opitutaceae bacterium]
MKTHQTSILIAALALLASPLFTATAAAATETLYSFSDNFDSYTATTLHAADAWTDYPETARISGQNGWGVADGNITMAIIESGSGSTAFQSPVHSGNILMMGSTRAYHTLSTQEYSTADILTLSGQINTSRKIKGGNSNLNAKLTLFSSAGNEWTGSTFLTVGITNDGNTSYASRLQYTNWTGSTLETVTVDGGTFAPTASNWYAIDITADLAAHTYAFTVKVETFTGTGAASVGTGWSVIYTSPTLNINPTIALPDYLKLQSGGGTDGGGAFDNIVFNALKNVPDPAIPEPATTSLLGGLLVLAGVFLSRRMRIR